MRLLLLFILYFVANVILAQNFKITDSKGNKITYVSVGVLNTAKGTVADENGFAKFTNLKSTDTLVFNHLNYERKKFALNTHLLKQNDTIKIKLIEKVINLKEVTVTNKAIKLKSIKRKGVLFAGGSLIYDKNEEKKGTLGEEYGEIINKRKDFILKQLNITCLKNSIDTCVFRFNLYSIEQDSSFKPLLTKPIYITFYKSDKKVKKQIVLNNYIPKGKIWVGLELVKYVGKGECIFPLAFSNGYSRNTTNNQLERFPMGLGHFFSLKGYYVQNKL